MDKVGEFRVEWMYIEKIIFVYWEGKVLSMEVITSIGKHKEIDLSLIELYASPLKKTISTFSCGKCEMVFVKLYLSFSFLYTYNSCFSTLALAGRPLFLVIGLAFET